jgi:hypothetical protein
VLYACDSSWWIAYFAEVSRIFHGEKWTPSARSRDEFDLNWIYATDKAGLSKDPTYITQGKNSGYQAIGLAHLFGARRILLLGFDFARSGGKTHWHGNHPHPLGNGGSYTSWVSIMNGMAKDLAAAGVEVINCSRKTALTCFPRSSIEEALCAEISSTSP